MLFETQSNKIGYAHIFKGWNGKYKIDSSGHGTNQVSYKKIKTNKGMYGILVGKNPDLEFDHIHADLYSGEFSFTSDLSDDEVFVKYQKLPGDIEQPFPAELTFYEKNRSESD